MAQLKPGLCCFVGNVLLYLGALAMLTACSQSHDNLPAAPLNNRPALQSLADAYNKTSENIPVNPAKMRPQARRKFLEDVFSQAGFNYAATLEALTRISPQDVTQYHKDMKELLFLAHNGFSLDKLPDIYNDDEQKQIQIIAQNIK